MRASHRKKGGKCVPDAERQQPARKPHCTAGGLPFRAYSRQPSIPCSYANGGGFWSGTPRQPPSCLCVFVLLCAIKRGTASYDRTSLLSIVIFWISSRYGKNNFHLEFRPKFFFHSATQTLKRVIRSKAVICWGCYPLPSPKGEAHGSGYMDGINQTTAHCCTLLWGNLDVSCNSLPPKSP